MGQGISKGYNPGCHHREDTELRCYRYGIVQRVTDGCIAVVSHGSQQKTVNASKPDEEYLGQVARVRIPLCPDTWLASILGMMVEVKQISTKARLARKKDMGAWNWVSVVVARIMSMFTSPVTKYMRRNSRNSSCCCLGSSERPWRRASETQVRFALSLPTWINQRGNGGAVRGPAQGQSLCCVLDLIPRH